MDLTFLPIDIILHIEKFVYFTPKDNRDLKQIIRLYRSKKITNYKINSLTTQFITKKFGTIVN